MASTNKRGPFQFQVQIRRKNYPTQTKTFETRREAKAWVNVILISNKRQHRHSGAGRNPEASRENLLDTGFRRCDGRLVVSWADDPF